MSDEKPTLAASLRMLADLIDEHPEIEGWYRYPRLGQHLTGEEAIGLDGFADVFGVSVRHDEEPNSETGARYSDVEAYVGRIEVRLQARMADYEQGTGKTAEQTPAATS